jgi:hypothetical protein
MEPLSFYGLSQLQKLILISKKKLLSKPKFKLSANKMISFMRGDTELLNKCVMSHLINLGLFFEKIFSEFSQKDVNDLKNQLEKGKSKCRVVELALKNFLLTISLYKAYADIINASDSFYFSRKKYDEECDKIYKAINVSVTIGLMTQYEKKLCQENVKYSRKFLERCSNIDDNIVISKDNIEIIKIGYLSSQQISNLEHGHRMKIATRYLTLYDHRDKVMETYRENNYLNDDELYKKKNYDFPMEINLLLFYLKKYIVQFNDLIRKSHSNNTYKYIACLFIKLYIYIHNISVTSTDHIYTPDIFTGVIGSCLGDLFELHKFHYIDMQYVMSYTILNDRTIIKRELYRKYEDGTLTHEEYYKQLTEFTNEQLPYYLKIDDFINEVV